MATFENINLSELKKICDYNKYDFKWENSVNSMNITVKIPKTQELLVATGSGNTKVEKKRNAIENFLEKYKSFLNIDNYKEYRKQQKENKLLPPHKNRYIIHAKETLKNTLIFTNAFDQLKYLGNILAIDSEGEGPALIQISDGQRILLFNYNFYKNEIVKYLNNPEKTLIFCDAKSDIRHLKITNPNYFDIQKMWTHCHLNGNLPNLTNLKAMASHINNITPVLLKPNQKFYYPDVKWLPPYDAERLHFYYAAYDVYVTYQIYEYLTNIINEEN